MKRVKSIALAALAVMVSAAGLLAPQSASAVSSAALSIVPKKNYTINPGKSVRDTLTIRNLDNERPLNLSLRVVDFTFTDEGGTPKLFLDQDAPQTTWSLKPFLTVPQSVTVPPNTSKTVDMNVAIPANQGAGSFYSAIVYSSGSSDGGNVGLSASGVTLVFTSIPGEVDEKLTLDKFGAYDQANNSYKFITANEPKTIAFTLKNDGNVTESPVGSITLRNMFGQEQQINDVNPNGSLALIGQSRTFTSCIKLKAQEVDFNGQETQTKTCDTPGLWPGHYSADLQLYYGQNGNRTQEIVGKATFWYLPWWFVIISLILLAIIAYVVWRAYRKVREILYGNKPRRSSSRRRR